MPMTAKRRHSISINSVSKLSSTDRHCEEFNDEATQRAIQDGLGCFAALAMTIDDTLLSKLADTP